MNVLWPFTFWKKNKGNFLKNAIHWVEPQLEPVMARKRGVGADLDYEKKKSKSRNHFF